jgi:hypothetical protein
VPAFLRDNRHRPGAINLASGDTGVVAKMINGADNGGDTGSDGVGRRSLIGDAQP